MIAPVVVIPVGPGRADNLMLCLEHLAAQTRPATGVVLVHDGPVDLPDRPTPIAVANVHQIKHVPGLEQPRNVGVRVIRHLWPDAEYVWFLDTDIIVVPTALETLMSAIQAASEPRIVVAPYDWMAPGHRALGGEVQMRDPRWDMFVNSPPDMTYRNDLSAGLACFSGNLVWPIAEFERVGGFWNEIHHGRCEDGELGLRAVAMDVPICFQHLARGWHLWHPVNVQAHVERNERDVPMLNQRHPWVERGAVFMVDRDGKAFDVLCPCGKKVPTIGWWEHAASCPHTNMALPVGDER